MIGIRRLLSVLALHLALWLWPDPDDDVLEGFEQLGLAMREANGRDR